MEFRSNIPLASIVNGFQLHLPFKTHSCTKYLSNKISALRNMSLELLGNFIEYNRTIAYRDYYIRHCNLDFSNNTLGSNQFNARFIFLNVRSNLKTLCSDVNFKSSLVFIGSLNRY